MDAAASGDARGWQRVGRNSESVFRQFSEPVGAIRCAIAPYELWWDQVYAMLDREFPGFFIHKTRYPRSVYFAPETPGQGRYLRLDFKGHKGEVDLAFKNVSAPALSLQVSNMNGLPGQIVANGKSSAIQMAGLAPFVISDGFEVIQTRVRAAYEAAHTLLTFWQRNRAQFDTLALQIKTPLAP